MPAIAYWYLEENYPLRIAVTGGLVLALLEITFEKIYFKKVHTISTFNFILILLLAGLSLLGEEGIWFKLQPCFTGLGIGSFLIVQSCRGKSLMGDMMGEEQKSKMPPFLIPMIEKHLAYLFMSYGLFMGYVAKFLSTDQWLFFKTIGFYIAFAFFMAGEFILIRWKVKKLAEYQLKKEVLKR